MAIFSSFINLISLALLVLALTRTTCGQDFPVIDSPKIAITYSVDGGNIIFNIIANGTGYVGIGFSNDTGMTNSDMFIGGFNADGTSYSGDYTSRLPGGTPSPDAEQNWELVSGGEEGGMTTMTVSRGIDTGDINDVQIKNETMAFIWAIGIGDDHIHHGVDNRGQVFMNFLIDLPTTTEPPTTTTVTEETTTVVTEDTTIETTPEPTTPEPITGIIIDSPMIQLHYTITGDKITFDVLANTTGYVGLGFSNSSGMTNSDIFIGGVFPDGTPYSGDYTSPSVGVPNLDAEQDWKLDFGLEALGYTQLKMTRLLVTEDLMDVAIEDKVMTIIWAMGNSDQLGYHGIVNRGQMLFNLMQGTPAPAE